MRLKEPLFGLRVAKMHILMHFGMAIIMLFIMADVRKLKIMGDAQPYT
jgi:hypothetical protein